MDAETNIPFDLHKIHRQAIDTFFQQFEALAEGALATDAEAKIVWINNQYLKFLGLNDRSDVIGRTIDDVIPGSLIPLVLETGEPILLDLMEFDAGWCVVSRFPIKNENGDVIGAFGFVLYGNISELTPLVSKVQSLQLALSKAQKALKSERLAKYSFSQFIGSTPAALRVKREARIASTKEATVILLGETGTGKELLAQAIHAASPRAHKNFVPVNVAAIPETLIEAEFFGVAPGAYTGAHRKGRVGKFELANGGTLFLDEIGEISQSMQVKLLRALQERQIEPVGSNRITNVDFRLLAATSRDLEQMVADGRFRADLFFRLNVIPIHVPALRDRLGDVEQLCEALIDELALSAGISAPEIEPKALELLQRYNWPGNIRELRNVLERMMVSTNGAALKARDVRKVLPKIAKFCETKQQAVNWDGLSMKEAVENLEKRLLRAALERSNGNNAEAADLLQMPRSTFYTKLRQHNF